MLQESLTNVHRMLELRAPVSDSPLLAAMWFSGSKTMVAEFLLLEMGVRNTPALAKRGDSYVVSVPSNGRLETSTLLERPSVTFKNHSAGRIWGYSQSVYTTGDGISVGGKIEFFVCTQKEFEAEQIKKNDSRDFHLQDIQA